MSQDGAKTGNKGGYLRLKILISKKIHSPPPPPSQGISKMFPHTRACVFTLVPSAAKGGRKGVWIERTKGNDATYLIRKRISQILSRYPTL